MDAALSDSSISNDDSNSEVVEDIEDDFEMSSPAGTDVSFFPYALQQFPISEYNKLCEGLYRLPSWMVYPADLGLCLAATVNIIREASRTGAGHAETLNIKKLMRDTAPFAFEKCFSERSVFNWGDNVQQDIFAAAMHMVELTALKLKALVRFSGPAEAAAELEDDLAGLLEALSRIFDPQSFFHQHNKNQDAGGIRVLEESFALPLRSPAVSLGDSDAETIDAAEDMVGEQFSWLTTLLNCFAEKGGFTAVTKLCEQAPCTFTLLRLVLEPLTKVLRFLSPEAKRAFASPCAMLLEKHMHGALADGVEALSDAGRDRMFNGVSALFCEIYTVLASVHAPLTRVSADEMVSTVQREFVEKLLEHSVFSKHMAAVREINNMLTRAKSVRTSWADGGEKPMKDAVGWLVQKNIVQALLRAHLHQRQYVDQVQKVLKTLASEGGLRADHLELLWNLTEKVDTFEAVKTNVYSVLGDLAKDLDGPELDLLFSKFEACTGWPAPDTLKAMDLLKQLAKSDAKGTMAQRVLGLLWGLTFAPGAPAEVAQSRVLSESLHHYASVDEVGTPLVWDYIKRCVSQIKADDNPMALTVLNSVIEAFPARLAGAKQAVQSLQSELNIVEVVVSSLEAFKEKAHRAAAEKAAAAAAPGSPAAYPDAEAELTQQQATLQYLTFLTNTIGPITAEPLQLKHLQRLWGCLIARPVCNTDAQLAFQLLFTAAEKDYITCADMAAILTENFPTLDPASLTPKAYECFQYLLKKVAFEEGKLQNESIEEPGNMNNTRTVLVSRDLDMKGLSYLWRVVLDGPPNAISDRARILLVGLHTNLADDLVPEKAEVRAGLLRSCLERLLDAAHALTGLPAGSSDWVAFGGPVPSGDTPDYERQAQRAVRCLAVMQQLVEEWQGPSMPASPAHAASFQGQPTHVDVNMQNMQGGKLLGAARGRIPLYTNDYVGVLRRKVAAKMAVPAPHVRLLFSGQELRSDSRLVQDAGLVEGHSIHAIYTPQNNSYTEPAPAVAGAQRSASPALLLAQQDGFYGVLLCLSDFCPVTAVRHAAARLLDMLPTDRAILEALRAAIGLPTPAQSLAPLLLPTGPDGQPVAKPARLLYTLQALNSLLFPSYEPQSEAAASLQRIILTSGCVGVMLRALQTNSAAYEKDILSMRKLYATMQLLLSRLLKRAATAPHMPHSAKSDAGPSAMSISKPAGSAVTMEISAASTASGGAGATKAEEAASTNVQAPMGTAPSTASSDSLASPSFGVDAPILQEMLLFFVHLALNACSSWGAPPPPQAALADASEDKLPEEDARLFVDALNSLRTLLEWQRELVDNLLSYEGALQLMVDGLLNVRHEEVRRHTASLMQLLARQPRSHAFLLGLLVPASDQADAVPHHCAAFYRLFCNLVHTIPDMPPEVQQPEVTMAEMLLRKLVRNLASPDESMADNVPGRPPGAGGCRLEGKLKLTLALVQILDRRSIGTCSDSGLVVKLLSEYLFPAAALLARLATERGFTLAVASQHELYLALNARCSSKASRQAALELVADLMEHSIPCLKEGLQHLMWLHFQTEPFHENDFNILPPSITRQPSGFVGLKNAGATCYMNAVFQQLFMQPSIRALVLGAREEASQERHNSTFYQFQRMFAHLALSHAHFFKPFGFWKTFKDYDGEPLNVREHQDAYEFFTRLQDLVDQHLRERKETPAMQAVMGGTFAQQIICRSVPYRSEKEEDFYQISLDVRGKKNLEESLDFYCQGELMEGDNQYFCEEVGKKVDAVKRNCIKVLPHTLVIHLKRFEFDYETMTRWKIKDRFEFPQELDMYKYTVDGLAAREEADAAADADTAAASSSYDAAATVRSGQPESVGAPAAAAAALSAAEPTSPKEPANAKQYQYTLKGIVVHSGSAFAGHYYSYIKVRKQEGQGPASGQWLCFDDNQVEPWDIANLDRDCFGGKHSDGNFGDRGSLLGQVVHDFDRPHSAYMLFYERSEELEPIEKLLQASVPAAPTHSNAPTAGPLSKGLEADMTGADPGAQTAVSAQQVGGGGQSLSTVPIPNMAATCPSILHEVIKSNLDEIEDVHLLDNDFFKFLRRLVEANLEACQRKLRRTEPSPTKSAASASSAAGTGKDIGSAGGSARGSLRAGRNEDMEHVALLTTLLAIKFIFMVYLKAHSTLRDDMREWRSAFQALYEATPLAARMLLSQAASEPCLPSLSDVLGQGSPVHELPQLAPHFLENYITRNDQEDVRTWIGEVIIDALRFVVRYDGGDDISTLRESTLEEGSSGWVVECLLMELKRAAALRPRPPKLGQLQQRLWNEHIYNIIKAYADLGPLQREHIKNENILGPLLKAAERVAEHGLGRETPPTELVALFHLLSTLLRRMQHPHEVEGARNRYGIPPEAGKTRHICSADTFMRMTSREMIECFLSYSLLSDKESRLLLKWLLWGASNDSHNFLLTLIAHIKKARPEDICDFVEEIAELVVVEDALVGARVQLFLGIDESAHPHSASTGLLATLFQREIRNYLRKFVFVRIVLAVARLYPECKMELAQYGDWLPIYNSLLRESGYDAAQPPSIVRRQIGFTVEELQDVLTGIKDLCMEDEDVSADGSDSKNDVD